ncbi:MULTISPECIES: hypothetical protein [unclassified Aeromicrobium]|uniref:hypothetical protein n=1 Tax=unclassified Aeromicrobium TaxID=2633570 RepID=UPI00396B0C18
MSEDGLFHIGANGDLTSMTAAPYEAEDVLQTLLETHPDLLAGGQMTPEEPRRWALVKREQGVPDRDGSGSRWSVDHLFVDQDAVPTLVEVKRSTDTRIRREVVGQMLDYAANGVRYWPPDALRIAFETTQAELGSDPRESVYELHGDPEVTIDEFFTRIGDNLRGGRIRMVFVADHIPDELRRIVEFLNEQLTPAEVFAVEVKQYRAQGYDGTVIVPAVYGRTAAASAKTAPRRSVDRQAAFAASKPSTLEAIELLNAFASDLDLIVDETGGGAILRTPNRQSIAAVYLADWDSFEVSLRSLQDRGWIAESDAAYDALSRMTAKRLTRKLPTMPTEDAVAHWDELRAVLAGIVALYLSAE